MEGLFSTLDALTVALQPLRPFAQSITVFEFPEVQAQLAAVTAPHGAIPATVDVVKCVVCVRVSPAFRCHGVVPWVLAGRVQPLP
jgi:hypothetical protein